MMRVVYILLWYVYWILGINKRNLAYIKKLNPQKGIRLADNKSKTKNFLEQRSIPVPKTYKHIKDRKELLEFDFGTLPSDIFVIKPNKWSKGKGIFILKRIPLYPVDTRPVHRRAHWLDRIHHYIYKNIPDYPYGYEYRWRIISDSQLKKKLVAIFEGNYTLSHKADTILIEEKILPGSWFEQFCEHWLADIRVIICNLVPVAAMLRMPTIKSGGVANLAQWGMAFGIDIPKGVITTLATDTKIYYKDFPQDYAHLYKFAIPFWEDILLYSANIQYFVNMGYIGIDWVITPQWPKLLEINGKAWLEIQNITGIPLEKSLDKITDLHIPTPEKWVEIARSLFTPAKDTSISSSKVLFLSQRGTLSYVTDDSISHTIDVVVVAKPNKMKNYISLDFASTLKNTTYTHVKIGQTILKNLSFYGSDHIHGHRIELWGQTLKNYYIRPIHKSHANISFIAAKNILESEVDDIKILDKKLHDIVSQFSLLTILFPTNYLDEFDKFISHKGNYNPFFSYHFPLYKDITAWQTQLQQLVAEHTWSHALKSLFAQLFYKKFDEIADKIHLIYAYKKQDYDKILLYNQKLYGTIDNQQVSKSEHLMHQLTIPGMIDVSQKIDTLHMRKIIQSVFEKYNIKKYKIQPHSSMLVRISFINGQTPILKIDPRLTWTEWQLVGQLEHEIGVHIQRAKHGRRSKWSLLQRGTAYYLADEEGLAIYQAQKTVQTFFPTYYNTSMHKKYVLTHLSEQLSFSEIVAFLVDMSSHRSIAGAFKSAMRLKRGIVDTHITWAGTTFMKDKLYFDGYTKISQWIENGGDIERLMIGKIKIEDLDFIG